MSKREVIKTGVRFYFALLCRKLDVQKAEWNRRTLVGLVELCSIHTSTWFSIYDSVNITVPHLLSWVHQGNI